MMNQMKANKLYKLIYSNLNPISEHSLMIDPVCIYILLSDLLWFIAVLLASDVEVFVGVGTSSLFASRPDLKSKLLSL